MDHSLFSMLKILTNDMFQVSDLIAELASAAAAEKGFVFEEGIEERLCAYSRAVAHFPTAVKEVKFVSFINCLRHLTVRPSQSRQSIKFSAA